VNDDDLVRNERALLGLPPMVEYEIVILRHSSSVRGTTYEKRIGYLIGRSGDMYLISSTEDSIVPAAIVPKVRFL
jgi:hypothetical protein